MLLFAEPVVLDVLVVAEDPLREPEAEALGDDKGDDEEPSELMAEALGELELLSEPEAEALGATELLGSDELL
jgi:hypothetical protein